MINIFIGTEPKTEIARKVLEFSISQQTKFKVKFHSMLGDSWSVKPVNGVGTGFSLLRWDIPRRMEYAGAAIYLDADIICLGDISELYQADIEYRNETSSVWCTYQAHKWYPEKDTPETSVMLIDCAKAKSNQPNYIESLEYIENDPEIAKRRRYGKIMRALKHKYPAQKISNRYNSLNAIKHNSLLLHYTIEPQQPWYNPQHKHVETWRKWLLAALEAGYVEKEEVRQAIASFRKHTKAKRGTGMHPDWKKYL